MSLPYQNSATTLFQPPLPEKPGQALVWQGLHGASRGLAIAEAARKNNAPCIIILEDLRQLHLLEEEICFFLGDELDQIPVHFFPGWECLPYDIFSPHPDIISDRLKLLSSLPQLKKGVVLLSLDNLIQKLPHIDYVHAHSFHLKCHDQIEIDQIRQKLVQAHYVHVNQVVTPGEYAVRGGLIDIFPMGQTKPLRIDLFDNEIDTIRYFDPETQRSSEHINEITLLPAREFPMTEDGINRFRSQFRQIFEGDPLKQSLYKEVSEGRTPAGTEFYFPLFFEQTSTLFDYLCPDSLFIIESRLSDTLNLRWAEIKDRYNNANIDSQRRVLPPKFLYLEPTECQQLLKQQNRVYLEVSDASENLKKLQKWCAPNQRLKEYPVNAHEEKPYAKLVDYLTHSQHKILITSETVGRMQSMQGMLTNHAVKLTTCDSFLDFLTSDYSLCICQAKLERGLYLPEQNLEIIGESQLYGDRVMQRRRRQKQQEQDPGAIIRSLAELEIGDPIVHIEHGVGRYQGLTNMSYGNEDTEYLIIEYQNQDKLYVPILSLNLISRYLGGSPEHAPIHKLGSEQWQKAKTKAQQKAYDVAAELLEAQALRETRKGNSFMIEENNKQQFISYFPFEETPDQLRVMEEIEADLLNEKPMDRLVCGDVGFGKTEIALRTANIVSQNQKQVAVLAPTTLLAQQHYQTFVDRFAPFNAHIGVLSRFNTAKQTSETLKKLENGEIDIIVGTHRLLQNDIKFCDLGLLIIDEEQRFGVRQKEKIKHIRNEVDILTLTATPIPRTLNLSMSGLRDISIIASPPENRISVKTFVRNWNKGLIREACLREIRRGGQVYFLHNDIKTIERMVEELREIIPEASINYGHGRMSEMQLERVMQDFYHQRFNIFVCTTIIESGIDIPLANTIIINRADRFGLAQLHQLRGRVGRSHHQAYAYLLVADIKLITKDARKRLEAIDSIESLGAGFNLATHDLEIRGTGELLGESQSGSIDDVGFSLYNEYLSLAVKSLKSGQINRDQPIEHAQSEIELHIPSLFPADYLPNTHTRLILYKRIASAKNDDELDQLQIEVIDRFGLMPEAAKHLFKLTSIRLELEQLGIDKVDMGEYGGTILFNQKPKIDPQKLLQLIQQQSRIYQFEPPRTLRVKLNATDAAQRIELVTRLIQELQSDSP